MSYTTSALHMADPAKQKPVEPGGKKSKDDPHSAPESGDKMPDKK